MQNNVLAVTFGAGKDPGGHSRLPTTSSIPRRPFTARMEAVADLILSLISYLLSLISIYLIYLLEIGYLSSCC